jgi:hypothetical protein
VVVKGLNKIFFHRWGQTPLQEAINFKHVKVAAILRRHERSKSCVIFKSKGKAAQEAGEALWRKLVEKKFLKHEEKKKPVFKVNILPLQQWYSTFSYWRLAK